VSQIRIVAKDGSSAHALALQLNGNGDAFSQDGSHEVRIRLDSKTATSLIEVFHAIGRWLNVENNVSCEIYFDDRLLTVVAPTDGSDGDATQFLLERTIQLQTALESRVLIEQAKGVLAERLGISVDEAFALIRVGARSNGTSLTGLAKRVVSSPETPEEIVSPAR
jgi:hypothetical protein